MFYLKALAAIVGFIVFLNLLAFILELVWMMPFGAPVATVGFFALAIWGIVKLAIKSVEGNNN